VDNLSTKLHTVDNWRRVLEIIKNQVSTSNFKAWFAQTKAEAGDGVLTVEVQSAYIKEQLSTKLSNVLGSAVGEVFGPEIKVQFKVNPGLIQKEDLMDIDFALTPNKSQTAVLNLNPKYTMESFVVGLSNNLAYAAAQAVIQNPGVSYNPLFIYGGTGVGKTHLMQAVGNSLAKKNPGIKIIYCSSERFTNDLIESIQTKKTNPFRNKYRSCDLLLIDDVQFIAGRDSTQEEFFHTFNELQAKNAQIVLTSDRPPGEMQKLESRLASRFQGGLMVDIQNPDFDTRVAILRAKCAERKESIAEECLTAIAEAMPTNARELEGKLIQIIQTLKLSGKPVCFDEVKKLLGHPTAAGQKLDYKKVISGINQYFNIKMADIIGPRRKKELVLPRHLIMYLLYQECKLPYERIGELLGGRDHTTIMHGVEKISKNRDKDRELQRILLEVRQSLQ